MEKDLEMFFALYYLVLYYSFVIMCFYIWGLGFRKLFFDVTFSVTMIKLNSHCTFKILVFQIFFIKILFFSYKIKWSDKLILNAINFNFITNNVKGLLLSKKRLKLFEYFRNKLSSNGMLFLQETHSTINNELKWKDKFKGALFFPM